ncbi:MAG: hypothetical protein J0L92_26235 [Deltaproteobacteria bacterium]|nr:hypothetical protein [Deltaproteobacteria bacterium]
MGARAERRDGSTLVRHRSTRYLPIGTEVPLEIAVECARVLPLDRLEAVAPTLLEKAHGSHAIQLGLAICRWRGVSRVTRTTSPRSALCSST